jgi:hypothetical protein
MKAWLNLDAGRTKVHEGAKATAPSIRDARGNVETGDGFEFNASNDHDDDDLLTMHVLPWNVAVANAKHSLLEIKMEQLRERAMPDPAALGIVVEMLDAN